MNKRNSYFIICLLLFISFSSVAQETRKELEAKRKEIQREKIQINKLLSEAVSKEKGYLSQLNEIILKIDIQEKLIAAYNAESRAINSEIRRNQNKINVLRAELKALKKDYGDMIYKSYKSKSEQSRIMFVMSSDNFYQAYKRLQYMKQYTDFRRTQGEQIAVKAATMEQLNNTLKVRRKEQEKLRVSSKKEQKKLEEEKISQEEIVSEIKKQEKKYKAEIIEKQKQQQRINAKIDKIIRDAIAKANKKKGKKSSKFVLTAETKLVATKFKGNKGKLPWPVDNGFVSTRYGKQKHPIYKNNEIQSNGVRITTAKGSNARASFGGTVLLIQKVSGNKKAVFVQHGSYITLYSGLESVRVKKGDKVSIKQVLGKIYTDKITNKTILSFQIWKNTTRLNPALWIYKM
ncbi:MAG: peptidoglycan DD-metalloendopeptidase family protein [Flavobacteriaceae bacterium]|nr:peptidoglycan DD-metalloendopeptidase family protein [Flavobacteriaceae bacterium]